MERALLTLPSLPRKNTGILALPEADEGATARELRGLDHKRRESASGRTRIPR
jgi:hypothetical protein